MTVANQLTDMHFLSEHRRSFQADQCIQMGASSLCDVDSRSLTREHHVHGTSHGSRESTKESVETCLLPMQPKDGCLRSVWKQKLLLSLSCQLRKKSSAVPENEEQPWNSRSA